VKALTSLIEPAMDRRRWRMVGFIVIAMTSRFFSLYGQDWLAM